MQQTSLKRFAARMQDSHRSKRICVQSIIPPLNTSLLLSLSDELFVFILKNLTWDENINISLVCKKWYHLASDDSVWRNYCYDKYRDLGAFEWFKDWETLVTEVNQNPFRFNNKTKNWRDAFRIDYNRTNCFHLCKSESNAYSNATVFCKTDSNLFIEDSKIKRYNLKTSELKTVHCFNSKNKVTCIVSLKDTIFTGFHDGTFELHSTETSKVFNTLSRKDFMFSTSIESACLNATRLCTFTKDSTLSLYSYSHSTLKPHLIYTQMTDFTFSLIDFYFKDSISSTQEIRGEFMTTDCVVMVTSLGPGFPLKLDVMEFTVSGLISTSTQYALDSQLSSNVLWTSNSEITSKCAVSIDNSRVLITGHSNNTICVFSDEVDFKMRGVYHEHAYSVTALCYGSGNLYSAGRCGMQVWALIKSGSYVGLKAMYYIGFNSVGCTISDPIMIVDGLTELIVVGDSRDDGGVVCRYNYDINFRRFED